MDEDLVAGPSVVIPAGELEWRATRSAGPGGQHVNTSATRVELVWDVARSAALSEALRARLLARLGPRLDARGRLRVVSSRRRSQLQNREAARDRLAELVAAAAAVPKARRATRPTRASRERRLAGKRRQAERKQDRRRPGRDD